MNKPEHLLRWMKKQKHIKQIAFADESGLGKDVVSDIMTGRTPINDNHYANLLPFCKKLGYKKP